MKNRKCCKQALPEEYPVADKHAKDAQLYLLSEMKIHTTMLTIAPTRRYRRKTGNV